MDINAILTPTLLILVMGMVLGVILGLASKFLKVEEDERVVTVLSMLPGFNCGACGHPGCSGFSSALVEVTGKLADCKPMKPDVKEKVKEYLAPTVDVSKL